jgi:hypothetical protein
VPQWHASKLFRGEWIVMSDFLDCLQHKYAYVAMGEFKPGCFPKARQLFETAVSTYGEGFKGAYLLQEPDSDRGIAVILWENLAIWIPINTRPTRKPSTASPTSLRLRRPRASTKCAVNWGWLGCPWWPVG